MVKKVIVWFLCIAIVIAKDQFEEKVHKVALKVLNDCSVKDDFSGCFKVKAVTFLDRLAKMQKFSLVDGISVVRSSDAPEIQSNDSEEQVEKALPRSADARSDALNNMLLEKLSNFLMTRSLEFSASKSFIEEARRGSGGGGGGIGGGGGGGGGKDKSGKKNMMMMMGLMGAKMYMLKSMALAGLFLLAKKALIVAKVALVLSSIIGLKALLAAKGSGSGSYSVVAAPYYEVGGGGGGGYGHGGSKYGGYGGGYGGGYSSGYGGSGGGWQKRNSDSQDLAYSSYEKSH